MGMVCNYNVTRTSFKSLGKTLLKGGTGNHPFNSQVLSWDSVQKRPLPPDKGGFFGGDRTGLGLNKVPGPR